MRKLLVHVLESFKKTEMESPLKTYRAEIFDDGFVIIFKFGKGRSGDRKFSSEKEAIEYYKEKGYKIK